MRFMLLIIAFLMQPLSAFAYTTIITPGDYITETITRTLLDDILVLQRPGGDGRLAFNELEKNKDFFLVISTSAIHVAPRVSEAYSRILSFFT